MMDLWILIFVLLTNGISISKCLLTIDINETNYQTPWRKNLTDLLVRNKEISNSEVIKLRPLDSKKMYPFALRDDGMLIASNIIDREEICPNSNNDRKLSLCLRNECCKSIGFNYNFGQKSKMVFVIIKIKDINDNAPQFRSIMRPYISISESTKPGYKIKLPVATDADSDQFSIKRYEIVKPFIKGDANDFLFSGENRQPTLEVRKLDYERYSKYEFILLAYDFDRGATGGRTGSVNVEIRIKDENDNVPQFQKSTYFAEVNENERNDRLFQYQVTDKDSGINGEVSVSLKGDESVISHFQILSHMKNQGFVSLITGFDAEEDPKTIKFELVAKDQGTIPLMSIAKVKINVKNVNDERPVISFLKDGKTFGNTIAIREDIKQHSVVVNVHVSDKDTSKDKIECKTMNYMKLFDLEQLFDGAKYLDVKIYQLKVVGEIDRESRSGGSYLRLQIECNDRESKPLRSEETLMIQIKDVNDNKPLFSQTTYTGEVEENESNAKVRFIQPITVTDKDINMNGKFQFKLLNLPGYDDAKYFSCDKVTGKLTAVHKLDYEGKKEYRFKILAEDLAEHPLNSTAMVIVKVLDVNDNAPYFNQLHYTFSVAEDVPIGHNIGTLLAYDNDTLSENKDVIYRIQMRKPFVDYVKLNRRTGVLNTIKRLDREKFSSIRFQVVAKNSRPLVRNTESLRSEVTVIVQIIDVNDNPPKFKLKPQFKDVVEFVIEEYVVDNACAELPYTVYDSDYDAGGGMGFASGDGKRVQGCCTVVLENDFDNMFSLLSDPPNYICLNKKPKKYQSRTVTLVAEDHPIPGQKKLTSKVSFRVVIKTNPSLHREGNKRFPPTNYDGTEINNNGISRGNFTDSKSLIIIAILVAVILLIIIVVIIIIINFRCRASPDQDYETPKTTTLGNNELTLPRSEESQRLNYQERHLLNHASSGPLAGSPSSPQQQHLYNSLLTSGTNVGQMRYPHPQQSMTIISNPQQEQYPYNWTPSLQHHMHMTMQGGGGGGGGGGGSGVHNSRSSCRPMSPTNSILMDSSPPLLPGNGTSLHNSLEGELMLQVTTPSSVSMGMTNSNIPVSMGGGNVVVGGGVPDSSNTYQILNPYGTTNRNNINYSPDILNSSPNYTPQNININSNNNQNSNEKSCSSLDNFYQDFSNTGMPKANNNASKSTPQTMKRNYFQTTFV